MKKIEENAQDVASDVIQPERTRYITTRRQLNVEAVGGFEIPDGYVLKDIDETFLLMSDEVILTMNDGTEFTLSLDSKVLIDTVDWEETIYIDFYNQDQELNL